MLSIESMTFECIHEESIHIWNAHSNRSTYVCFVTIFTKKNSKRQFFSDCEPKRGEEKHNNTERENEKKERQQKFQRKNTKQIWRREKRQIYIYMVMLSLFVDPVFWTFRFDWFYAKIHGQNWLNINQKTGIWQNENENKHIFDWLRCYTYKTSASDAHTHIIGRLESLT